jgi:hypothetical protein
MKAAKGQARRRKGNAYSISKEVSALLKSLATAHRIPEMEGHGDMTLGHMSVRDP